MLIHPTGQFILERHLQSLGTNSSPDKIKNKNIQLTMETLSVCSLDFLLPAGSLHHWVLIGKHKLQYMSTVLMQNCQEKPEGTVPVLYIITLCIVLKGTII